MDSSNKGSNQSSQSSSHPSSSSNPFSPKCEDNEPMDQGDSDEEVQEDVEQGKEQIPRALTESYTEITLLRKFCENPNQEDDEEGAVGGEHVKRPDSLVCDSVTDWEKGFGSGIVARDGNYTHFVADNLEQKIKLASPNAKKEGIPSASTSKMSTPSYLPRNFLLPPHLQPVDPNVLNDIEIEAQYLAASIDNLTENLCNLLHSISAITADNVDCYKNAVNKLTDCMDANIKHMYTIMAKTEEISKTMKPVEQLGQRIKELRKLVDLLESNL